jgi:hypothetical protein
MSLMIQVMADFSLKCLDDPRVTFACEVKNLEGQPVAAWSMSFDGMAIFRGIAKDKWAAIAQMCIAYKEWVKLEIRPVKGG